MKRTIVICISLALFAINSFAQDKYCRIPNSADPSFEYIRQYMPEYYYEGFLIDDDPSLFANHGPLSVKVRVYRNYVDETTFSFFVLQGVECWETLFVYEVDSLIVYLERVLDLMDVRPDDHNYYVYNSQRGIFLKTQWSNAGGLLSPYYELKISFPNGETIRYSNKKQVKNLIYRLKTGMTKLPPKETDFLYNRIVKPEKDWEIKDVDESNLVKI